MSNGPVLILKMDSLSTTAEMDTTGIALFLNVTPARIIVIFVKTTSLVINVPKVIISMKIRKHVLWTHLSIAELKI